MLPCISATSTPAEDDATVEISGVTYIGQHVETVYSRNAEPTLKISGALSRSCASLTGTTSKKEYWRHCREMAAQDQSLV